MRFEGDQVSDLTRRCEKVNIYTYMYIDETKFSNQISIFIQKKK